MTHYPFLPAVEQFLHNNQIEVNENIDLDHITLNIDRIMIDPGFAADSKLLDIFIDEDNHILFIGLLRLPKEFRHKHIGRHIAQMITDWAEQNNFAVFLDCCNETTLFWEKCGFVYVGRKMGFDIMGYGKDVSILKEKWKKATQLFYETH